MNFIFYYVRVKGHLKVAYYVNVIAVARDKSTTALSDLKSTNCSASHSERVHLHLVENVRK